MLLAWGLWGCTVIVQEEMRQVGTFRQVANLSRVDVEVVVGDDQVVGVLCEDDQIERLVTEVVNGELQIHTDHHFGDVWSDCEVTVNVPLLDAVYSGGEGDTRVSGELSSLERAESWGTGAMHLAGATQQVELESSGTGDLAASELHVSFADIVSSGAGDVSLYVTEQVTVTLTGTGSVWLAGQPEVEVDDSGTGQVIIR
jgi:hypothetical protein